MRELARGVLRKHGSRMKQTRPRLEGRKKESPAPHGATQGSLFD
jgi:hypothetical protein